MLNETVEEFIDAQSTAEEGRQLRVLLARLFGPGILDQRTATKMGRRVKSAVREAYKPEEQHE